MQVQTPLMQRAIYRNQLREKDDVVDWLMSQPNIMPRLNDRILNKENAVYLDVSGKATSKPIMNTDDMKLLSLRDMTATLMENIKYFTKASKTSKNYHMHTIWVTGDLDNLESRELLRKAIEYMVSLCYLSTLSIVQKG